jgi:hypothetical protein
MRDSITIRSLTTNAEGNDRNDFTLYPQQISQVLDHQFVIDTYYESPNVAIPMTW